ncbi:MAG: tripartite tricarboxylate transporter substrate binding protein [Xanthobacteraceae bacterium]
MFKLVLATAVGITAALATPAFAAGFPEKKIDFVIPFGPGGGFDRTVRIVSPALEKTLPNKVEVVPTNIAGAGGAKGTATVYRAAPDGHTIGIINMPGAAIPGLGGDDPGYDMNKLSFIAKLATEEYMLAVPAKSDIKTIDDIKKLGRPLKVPSTDFGSTAYAASEIFAQEMKFPIQHLTGYKGTNDYIVGVIRGDGDAAVAPVSTLKKFIESGDMRALFTTEEKSSVPGVKTIAEIGFADLTGLGVSRYVVGPPGMPADVVKTLSAGLEKAMTDPEVQKHADKEGFAFLPADKAKASADKALALYSKYKAALVKK